VSKGTFGSATGSSQKIGEIKGRRGCEEGAEGESEKKENDIER
jgi:hypothetical protein